MLRPSFLLSCTRAFPGRQMQLLYALAPPWDAFLLTASWTRCSISLFVCLFIYLSRRLGEGKEEMCFWWNREEIVKPVLLSVIGFGFTITLSSGESQVNETAPLHRAELVHPSFYTRG